MTERLTAANIPAMQRRAYETPDGMHRYSLTRIWAFDKPIILFIGLFPGHCNALKEDEPFTAKALELAVSWDYGMLQVANLFTNIKKGEKAREKDLTGPRNLETIYSLGKQARLTIFCWGDHGKLHPEYVASITNMFPKARCFGKTESGHPVSLFDVKDAEKELQLFNA